MFRHDSKLIHFAIIVVLGVLIYVNTLDVPFYLDDYRELAASPLIKSFSYLFRHIAAGGIGGLISRNFGYLTFAFNYQIGDLNVVGYHLVNIAIHLMAALALYSFVCLTLRTPFFSDNQGYETVENRVGYIALATALLFVAHPLQTQAVTYIVQRFASLAALLYLASMNCYVRARLNMNKPEKPLPLICAWFVAAIVAALLAFMSKQNTVTLPLMIILYEFMFFTKDLKKKAAVLCICCAVAVAGMAILFVAAGKPAGELLAGLDRATTAEPGFSRLDYLATQLRVLVTYLRLLIFPVGQQLDYYFPLYTSFLNRDVLMSAILLSALFAGALYCMVLSRRKECRYGDASPLFRLTAFGIFWFFVALSVESSIIPITDVIVEHRMYLPSAGIFMAVTACVSLFGGTGRLGAGWPRTSVLAGTALVVLILGVMAVARNQVWRDDVGFWEDNASRSPLNARVLNNLAQAKLARRDLRGAEQAFLKALALNAYEAETLVNLGQLYFKWNRLDEAQEQYRRALSVNPDMAQAHMGLGSVYARQLRTDNALQEFSRALELDPDLADAYNDIGLMYVRQRKIKEAVESYNNAIEHNPDSSAAYVNRGLVFLGIGRRSEAITDFRRALAIDPGNATATAQLRWLAGQR